jgi:hypothetical protein
MSVCVRRQLQGVHPFGSKIADQSLHSADGLFAEEPAHLGIRRIELDEFAGFGVFQREHSHIGQHSLARIFDVHRNQIVPKIRLAHRPAQVRAGLGRVSARLKIGD